MSSPVPTEPDNPQPEARSPAKAVGRRLPKKTSHVRGLAWVLAVVVLTAAWHFWPQEKRHYMVPPSSGQYDHSHRMWRPVLAPLAATGRPSPEALRAQSGALKSCLRQFSAVTPAEYHQWDSAKQTAFVLNVYQASVLGVQAEKLARNESMELNAGWGGDFSKRVVRFLGRLWSLNELEKEWLTRSTRDPRAAAVLYRGTAESPSLRAEPFTADRLEAQLREAGKAK